MTDGVTDIGTFHSAWFDAEARYTEALTAFSTHGPPQVVLRESALELAKARNTADRARDRYFRAVLK